MARKRKFARSRFDEPGLNISSLIDVCFLLLIYFLVTTQIVRKEQELSSTTPGCRKEFPTPVIAPLYLLVEAEGAISIKNETGLVELLESNPESRFLPVLTDWLELYQSAALVSGQTPLVQIQVADEAIQQRVIDVLNALAGVGIKDITFVEGRS